MIHVKTILHPTDFSEDSRYALDLACALARDQAARVILLHVLPRPILIGRDSQVPAYKEMHAAEDREACRQEVEGRLQELRQELPRQQVETLLREGDVGGVILRTAAEIPCELIVMGTHGRSPEYQLMMGSVALEVTQNAPCPVVTVKAPLAASPDTDLVLRAEAGSIA